jgi:hypothetical protein
MCFGQNWITKIRSSHSSGCNATIFRYRLLVVTTLQLTRSKNKLNNSTIMYSRMAVGYISYRVKSKIPIENSHTLFSKNSLQSTYTETKILPLRRHSSINIEFCELIFWNIKYLISCSIFHNWFLFPTILVQSKFIQKPVLPSFQRTRQQSMRFATNPPAYTHIHTYPPINNQWINKIIRIMG